jgi:hypothetical protein
MPGLLKGEKALVAKGFITRHFVQDTRQQMEPAEQDGQQARRDLLHTDAEELYLTGRRDQEVA